MTDKTNNLLNENGILLISYLYEIVKDSVLVYKNGIRRTKTR